jgi:hypothetical protein
VLPPTPAPSPRCGKATSRVRTLARQHHRLQAHAQRAEGPRKKKLRHRAHHVGHEWDVAKEKAKAACG